MLSNSAAGDNVFALPSLSPVEAARRQEEEPSKPSRHEQARPDFQVRLARMWNLYRKMAVNT